MNIQSCKISIWSALVVLTACILTGCNPARYLDDDERLVTKNIVEFVGDAQVEEPNELKKELKRIIFQRPNRDFLLVFPREWYVLKNASRSDTSWLGKFALRNIAEPPTLVDSNLMDLSAENMELYLKQRGYFNATVKSEEIKRKRKKRSHIKYFVETGSPYILDSFYVLCTDTAVNQLIDKSYSAEFPIGQPLSSDTYDEISGRITNLLRNNGYYDFYPNFISTFQAYDTSRNEVKAFITIDPPGTDSSFTKYKLRDIYIYPDFNPLVNRRSWKERVIEDMMFRDTGTYYIVKPQVITERMAFRTGDIYNQSDYSNTISALGRLSIYKFPNIRVEKIGSNELDYHVYLRRNKNRVNRGNISMVYSTFSSNNRAFGVNLSGSSVYDNIFRGSERLTVGLDAQIEFGNRDFTTDNIIYDLNPSIAMSVPRALDLLGTIKTLNKIKIGGKKLASDAFMRDFNNTAITSFNFDIGHFKNQDIFRINSLDFNYDIRFERGNNREYRITFLGLNYWSPKPLSRFDDVAGDNILYRRSFDKQFLTGLIFRSINYEQASPPTEAGRRGGWSISAETSGLELAAVNSISNIFSGEPLLNQIEVGADTVQMSQFARFEVERRFGRVFINNSSLAFRIKGGLAFPFSEDQAVPYLKRFFVGGPNSIRAWQVRELGPGGNNDRVADENNVPFFQVGDVRMEFNAEYRFDLFWYLKGAFFVDIGNIWNIDKDAESITLLTTDFWKQFAIGTGFGLRFDVEYFLFRIDMGYPIKNNYRDAEPDNPNSKGSYFRRPKDYKLSDFNFNLGVGYPF